MCLYGEMVRVRVFASMFGTCKGIFDVISIWHASERTHLQSSFGWQTEALIIEERHDCSASCGYISGGTLPIVC